MGFRCKSYHLTHTCIFNNNAFINNKLHETYNILIVHVYTYYMRRF